MVSWFTRRRLNWRFTFTLPSGNPPKRWYMCWVLWNLEAIAVSLVQFPWNSIYRQNKSLEILSPAALVKSIVPNFKSLQWWTWSCRMSSCTQDFLTALSLFFIGAITIVRCWISHRRRVVKSWFHRSSQWFYMALENEWVVRPYQHRKIGECSPLKYTLIPILIAQYSCEYQSYRDCGWLEQLSQCCAILFSCH